MSQVSIRRAAKADAPVILTLLRELAVFEKLLETFRLDEAAVTRDLMGENAAAHCDLAFLDGEVAGLAVWYRAYASFRARRGLYIEDLYVRPAFRGRGLGRALLAHLARETGAGWMKWTVLDWNVDAIGFYERIGARPVEQWLTYALEGEAMTWLNQS